MFQRRSNEEEPENRYTRTGYVPASMRERPTPALLARDGDDAEHDEEIEFLANLAGEIDASPAEETTPKRAFEEPSPGYTDDDLAAFRTISPGTDGNDGVRRHITGDVEIIDLLDELNLTMAALRHRRAA